MATGTMLEFHNRGWSDVALGPLPGNRLGVPVFLQDDATAGAVSEAVYGVGAGLDPIAYLTVSSGISAGIVVAGEPLTGAHAQAGEIGHLVIDPAGPPCECGCNGDIESYAGGIALASRAAACWPGETLPDGTPAPRDAAAVHALAERGDQVAEDPDTHGGARARLRGGRARHTIDPARIIVGGSAALANPAWIRAAVAEARCAGQMRAIVSTCAWRPSEPTTRWPERQPRCPRATRRHGRRTAGSGRPGR